MFKLQEEVAALVAQNKEKEAPLQEKLDTCQAEWNSLKRKRKDADLLVHHKHSLEYKVLKQKHKEELDELQKRSSVEDRKWQVQITELEANIKAANPQGKQKIQELKSQLAKTDLEHRRAIYGIVLEGCYREWFNDPTRTEPLIIVQLDSLFTQDDVKQWKGYVSLDNAPSLIQQRWKIQAEDDELEFDGFATENLSLVVGQTIRTIQVLRTDEDVSDLEFLNATYKNAPPHKQYQIFCRELVPVGLLDDSYIGDYTLDDCSLEMKEEMAKREVSSDMSWKQRACLEYLDPLYPCFDMHFPEVFAFKKT